MLKSSRMFGGEKYTLRTTRKSKSRAKTYAENAKYMGFQKKYRIIESKGLYLIYGRGGRKK